MAVEMLGRPPPRLSSGRFVVVDELGEGGTAAVYLVWDTNERRWCALKALQHRHLSDSEIHRRFSQEAEALGRFDHPNIPRLFAHHPTSIPPFMVMELCRNGSVMDWLRDHGPMPPALATDVIYQVCEALGAAHAIGIVHRDVKPHNVLLDDEGVCKLTDFGIARIEDATSMTATGTQIGTFSFMAPEQRSNTKSVDLRADVYSVGASLYTLLTARTSAELFVAEDDDEILADIPAPFRAVILRMTRYRPDERYASVRDVQDAVLSALARLPPGPPEVHPPLVRDQPPLPHGPPAVLPPFRRFADLERCIALDSNQPTFVPASVREDLDALNPPTGSRPRATPARRTPEAIPLVAPALPAGVVSASSAPTASGGAAGVREIPPRPRSARSYGYVAAGVAALLIGLLLVMAGVGASQVRGARSGAGQEGDELVAAVLADPELGLVLGAERLDYERAYDAMMGASDAESRWTAAAAAVALAEAAVEQGAADPAARARLKPLHDRRERYLRARETWSTMSGSFPGSWAVAIGLAPRP